MKRDAAIPVEEVVEELAPQRRFRPYSDYRDSGIEWLGEIPKHWEIRKLKFLSDVRPSGVDKKIAEGEVSVRFLGTNSVYGIPEITDHVELEQVTASYPELSRFLLRDGDIILTKDSVVSTRIADVSIARGDLQHIICGYHLTLVRPHDRRSSDFLSYYLSSKPANSFFLSKAKGTTIIGIGGGDIGAINVPLPIIQDQRAIAAFLDRETARIDELIAKKKRFIELLAEKRTALITHTVTKGLDPDAPRKDSGIDWLGQVPDHWRLKKLRFLADGGLENGLFKKKQFFGSGVRLVNVFDVYREDFLIDDRTLERVEADGVETRRYAVEPGDIFFVRSSLKLEGVGKSACMLKLSEHAVFECHLVRMQPRQNAIRSHFLINFLNSVPATNRLIALANQVTMTTIDQGKFKSLEIPVPPLEEQEAIIELLSEHTRTFFALTSSVREAIDKLREYRSALISAGVTGKIDVRVEA